MTETVIERSTGQPQSPRASRLRPPRWADARLAIGLLLVLVPVVVGARVIAQADATVPVLAAAQPLSPGQQLTPELVHSRDVDLGDDADLYFTGPVGAGYVVVRPVGQGELLPRSAVAPAADAGLVRYVTLALPRGEIPPELGAGDTVDLWIAPATDAAERIASRLLDGVAVTAVSQGGGGFSGGSTEVQVTLAVPGVDRSSHDAELARLLAAARDRLVYLTRLPEVGR